MKNLCSQKVHKNVHDPNENTSKKKSKYTPYTKLSRQELIDIARRSSQRLKILNQKVKKLKEYRDKMQSVSESTDKDLRKMFDRLHKGIIKKERNWKIVIANRVTVM